MWCLCLIILELDVEVLLCDGGLCIDLVLCQVFVDGVLVEFMCKEFDIVVVLVCYFGVVVLKECLICEVWNMDWCGFLYLFEVYVGVICRKIGD